MNHNGANPPSKGARSGNKKPNMAAISVHLFVSAQNRPTTSSLLGWFSLSVSGLVLGRADQGRKQGKAPSTFCHATLPPAGQVVTLRFGLEFVLEKCAKTLRRVILQ